MLSGTSASSGVHSSSILPGFGREGLSPCSTGQGDALRVSIGLMVYTGFFPWVDVTLTPNGLLKSAGFVFSSAANRLEFAMIRAFGSPVVDVRLVPRLDVITEESLEKTCFIFS